MRPGNRPRVVLYHPNSFGGTYDYVLNVFEAWKRRGDVDVTLLLPTNAKFEAEGVQKILLPDLIEGNKVKRQAHFVWRSWVNPMRLWRYLRAEKGKTFVLFDEFDQLTALAWTPLFKVTKAPNHTYAIMLHDPDRDAYPPGPVMATRTMKAIMELMDIGFYHELLPDRPYYQQNHTRYESIPFGVYPRYEPDPTFLTELIKQKEPGQIWAGLIGNIRHEKNYHLAIQALPSVPHLHLVIAGRASSSAVDVNAYKALAEDLGVADRIIWLDRFLSDGELAAVITASDMMLLAYSATFKSQSAVLALVAPYHRNLVASDGASGLAIITRQFDLGELVEPDSLLSLIDGLQRLLAKGLTPRPGWADYNGYYTWDNHVARCLQIWNEVASL